MSANRLRGIAALVMIFLRRATPLRGLVALAAMAVTAASIDWAPHAELAALDRGVSGQELSRALTRQGVWTALLVVLAPWLVFASARARSAWRAPENGESDWLASLPVHRGWIAAAVFAGRGLAACALCLVPLLTAEIASPPAGSEKKLWRWKEALSISPVAIEDEIPHTWVIPGEDAPSGGALRVRFLYIGGSGAARLRASLERLADSSMPSEFELAISNSSWIELVLPHGTGDVKVQITRFSGEAMLLIPESGIEVLVPARRELDAGWSLYARASLAMLTWTALGLGAGAWMSPMSGVLLIAALWIPSWTRSPSPPWLPGGDLFESLSLLGQGIVPPAIEPGAVAVAAVMALLGMALFARGRWNPR